MKRTVLALLSVLYPFASLSGTEGPVIDVHLHVYDESRLPYPPHPGPIGDVARPETQEQLAAMTLSQMDEHNVVLGLLHDSPENIDYLRSKDADRFLSFPDLKKGWPQPTVDQFEVRFSAGEWSGTGEIRTVYSGLRPTDEQLWPYYDLANRHDLPVFWHSAGSFSGITRFQPEFRMDIGRPLNWEDVFVRYPDLRVVLMHAGYPFLDEMIAMLHMYPLAYVDTGAISHFHPNSEFYRYYGALIRAGFGKRILFGSDQMGWPEAIGYSVDLIRNAPWPDDVKRDILYNNAARFLRLTEKQIEKHYGAASD